MEPKTITTKLPSRIIMRLRAIKKKDGIAVHVTIRKALEAYLDREETRQ